MKLKTICLISLVLLPLLKIIAQQTGFKVTINKTKIISQKDSIASIVLPFIEAPPEAKDQRINKDGSETVGACVDVNIDYIKTATLVSEENNKLIFILHIKSPNALRLQLSFNQLQIPDSSDLYLESIDGKLFNHYESGFKLKGKYTNSNACISKELILRLETTKQKVKSCKINIDCIGHVYKDPTQQSG